MIRYGFEQENKKMEQDGTKIYSDNKNAYRNGQKIDGRVT